MTDHDEPGDEHRELLERVLTGELSIEHEKVQRALRADPSLAAELEALSQLAADLDDAGAGPRPMRADDERMPAAFVDKLLDEHLPPPADAAPSLAAARGLRTRLLAAAAALLLLGGAATGWWLSRDGDRPPIVSPDTQLGANDLWPADGDAPIPFDRFAQLGFRWGELDLRPGDQLVIRFTTGDAAAEPTRITLPAVTAGAPPSSAEVPPALLAERPQQLYWTLERTRAGSRTRRWNAQVRFAN